MKNLFLNFAFFGLAVAAAGCSQSPSSPIASPAPAGPSDAVNNAMMKIPVEWNGKGPNLDPMATLTVGESTSTDKWKLTVVECSAGKLKLADDGERSDSFWIKLKIECLKNTDRLNYVAWGTSPMSAKDEHGNSYNSFGISFYSLAKDESPSGAVDFGSPAIAYIHLEKPIASANEITVRIQSANINWPEDDENGSSVIDVFAIPPINLHFTRDQWERN